MVPTQLHSKLLIGHRHFVFELWPQLSADFFSVRGFRTPHSGETAISAAKQFANVTSAFQEIPLPSSTDNKHKYLQDLFVFLYRSHYC